MSPIAIISIVVGCLGALAGWLIVKKSGWLRGVGFAIAILLAPFIFLLVMGWFVRSSIRRPESGMHKSSLYGAVGSNLALYCQSDTNLVPRNVNFAWFPRELTNLGPYLMRGGEISTSYAQVEIGRNYSYRLERDDAVSTSKTNVWRLYFMRYGESEEPYRELLTTICLATSVRLSADELCAKLLARYDDLIRERGDGYGYQGKTQVYLRFDKVAGARQVCKSMLQAMPNDYWAVLVNALIVAEEESLERADQMIIAWAEKNRNFFAYLDLAYFYELTDRPEKAANAMVKSTEYDGNLSWGDGCNSDCRGYGAAIYAYRSGQYQAAVRMCDKLLSMTINGSSYKGDERGLKDLAVRASQTTSNSPPQALVSPWGVGRMADPFALVDIEKLLQRKISGARGEQYWKEHP